MPPAPQGAPHGTSVCREAGDIRDTAAVGQEGWTLPWSSGVLPCTQGVALSQGAGAHPGLQGQHGGGGAVLGLGRGFASLLPPLFAQLWHVGLALGTQSCPTAPPASRATPAACLRSSTSGKGEAPLLSLWNTPGLGGRVSAHRALLAPRGPAAPLSPAPPSAVYGHFLNTVFILNVFVI